MMRMIIYMLLLLCHLMPPTVWAQELSPEAYFNQASKEYIKKDKLTALRTLDKALREHPGDPRLLALAEELIKEDEQQQQQQQQQEQQQQDKQKEQEQNEDAQQDTGDGKGDEQESRPEQGNEQERSEQGQGREEKHPRSIAPQDARRMLDALERQEKDVQDKVRAKQRPANRRPIEKDW